MILKWRPAIALIVMLATLWLPGCAGAALDNSAIPPSPSHPESAAQLPAAHTLTPYALGESGYTVAPPDLTDVFGPNDTPSEPPHWQAIDQDGDNRMLIQARPYLSGHLTVLQPICNYGIMDGDVTLFFAVLQTFKQSDLQQENAAVRFDISISGTVYFSNYPYGNALPISELEPYKIYEDEAVAIYNFFDLIEAVPFEEQLKDWWSQKHFEQRGLNYDWLLKMRSYLLDDPGGLGRYIVPTLTDSP